MLTSRDVVTAGMEGLESGLHVITAMDQFNRGIV